MGFRGAIGVLLTMIENNNHMEAIDYIEYIKISIKRHSGIIRLLKDIDKTVIKSRYDKLYYTIHKQLFNVE